MLCRIKCLDKNLLHYHVHSNFLWNLLLQSLNLFFMLDMNLLDEFIGSGDHILMNLEHCRGSKDMVVKVVFITLLSFIQCMLQQEINESILLIGFVKFWGRVK